MPFATTNQSNFTQGVYTPLLEGRVDFEGYFNSTNLQNNFFSTPQGVAEKRKGFEHINGVKTNSKKTRAIPFVFKTEQAYIIELGDQYMRFYRNGGIILNDSDEVYEISSPYTQDQIFDIQFVQNADVLFIVHPSHKPKELTRTDHDSWTISNYTPVDDPFTSSDNYPSTITFHEQRIVFAGTNNDPQKIWFTKSADIRNLTTGTNDDDAFTITIAAKEVNAINNLTSDEVLYVGTTGGVHRIKASDTSAAITPSNINVKKHTSFGAANISTLFAGDSTFYVQKGKKTLRSLSFDLAKDKYTSISATLKAEHLTRESAIVDMSYQDEPLSIIWCVLSNGEAMTLVYEPNEEVLAWNQISTDGSIESVATIPGTSEDETWFVVKRTVNGSDVRYIERLIQSPDKEDLNAYYLDSFLTYNGVQSSSLTLSATTGEGITFTADSASFVAGDVNNEIHYIKDGKQGKATIKTYVSSTEVTCDINYDFSDDSIGDSDWAIATKDISGLNHLEAKEVSILANSAVHPNKTVSSGAITLDYATPRAIVGLAYSGDIKTQRLEGGSATGSSQGKKKRLNRVVVRLYKTIGLKVGTDDNKLNDIGFRKVTDSAGKPLSLFTGDIDVDFRKGWGSDNRLIIKHDYPTPCTIVSIITDYITNDSL